MRDRSLAWLKRRGYLDDRPAEERSNDAPDPSALEACTQLALAGGTLLKRPARANPDDGVAAVMRPIGSEFFSRARCAPRRGRMIERRGGGLRGSPAA